jgi:hypothetical protein
MTKNSFVPGVQTISSQMKKRSADKFTGACDWRQEAPNTFEQSSKHTAEQPSNQHTRGPDTIPDAGDMAEVIATALGEGKPVREHVMELSRKAAGCSWSTVSCSYRRGSLAHRPADLGEWRRKRWQFLRK